MPPMCRIVTLGGARPPRTLPASRPGSSGFLRGAYSGERAPRGAFNALTRIAQ